MQGVGERLVVCNTLKDKSFGFQAGVVQYRNWFFRSLAKPELLLLDKSDPERFEFEHDSASDDKYFPLEPPADPMCAFTSDDHRMRIRACCRVERPTTSIQ